MCYASPVADEPPSVTVEILKQIRDELRTANQRLSSLETHAMSTNDRLERVEVVLVRMSKVNDAVLDEQLKDAHRLEAIELRLRRIEQHVGLPPLGS